MPDEQLALYGIVLLGLASAIVVTVQFYLRRKQKQSHRVGLSALRELQILLAYMQQHRGMTNGFLHGEAQLQRSVITIRKKIIGQIHHIESTSIWLKDSNQWQIITEEWARLSSEFSSKDVEVNFNNHCVLIRSVLDAIVTTADYYGLSHLQKKQGQTSVAYLWRELLTVAELMGQARALGIGIAVDGFSTVETKARLRNLILEIEMASDLLMAYLPNPKDTQKELETFCLIIEDSILTPRPAISAMEFFREASVAINGLYEHYNEQMRRLTEYVFRL